MKLNSSYPVLMVADVEGVAEFYRTRFGFEPTFSSDWYVSLARREGDRAFELAVLRYDHPTVPEGFRHPSRGILVNLEVDDAAGEWGRLSGQPGIEVARALRDEEFGQRHFILVDPAGTLVDVIENIPPSSEYVEQYVGG